MSWSMIEPEELPVCECWYDEARDVMDRDDCPFHCDLPPDTPAVAEELDDLEAPPPVKRKEPATAGDVDEAAA